jgi:hypothetical protein
MFYIELGRSYLTILVLENEILFYILNMHTWDKQIKIYVIFKPLKKMYNTTYLM